MATRFYLPSSGAAPISPAFMAWGQTTSADRLAAVKVKIASAMTSKATANSSSIQTILNRQYVYGPLAAQTINGNVKGQLRGSESNNAMDAVAAIGIRIVTPAGATRATLLAITAPVLAGNEYTTSLTNRNTLVSTALTSGDATAGDYLVIEIGASQTATSANRSVSQSFGDDSATDLPEDQTTTATNNPWVEFSVTIADAVFTPDVTGFRFYADGKETGVQAIGNDGTRHAALNAIGGAYVSTPDSVAASITGDIDILMLIRPHKLAPAASQIILAKYITTGNNRTFAVYITAATGVVGFTSSADGIANTVSGASDAALSTNVVEGQRFWLRVTKDVDDGAGHNVDNYYTAPDDGTTNVPAAWTQLGSANRQTAGATSFFDGTGLVEISGGDQAGFQTFDGEVYIVLVKAGIAGVTKYEYNPQRDGADGGVSVVSASGETWTHTGGGSIAAFNTNITRAVNNDVTRLLVRLRVQETGGKGDTGASTYQLQVNKNAAGWNNVDSTSLNVRTAAMAAVADNAATTAVMTAGTGAFVAGKLDDGDGAVAVQLTSLNYTELAFFVELRWADLVDADVLTFRVLKGGATITYTQTPQITVAQSVAPPTISIPVFLSGYRRRVAA